MIRLGIRWQLTLWYGLVMAIMVGGFGFTVYGLMANAMAQQADIEVDDELSEFQSQLRDLRSLSSENESLRHFFNLHSQYLFEVQSIDGEVHFTSSSSAVGILAPLHTAQEQGVTLQTKSLDGRGRFRIKTQVTELDGETVLTAIAIPMEPYEQTLRQILQVLCTVGPLLLLVAIAAGYFLACRALSPVEAICDAAERITADNLNERISTAVPDDELGRLAKTFNRMLDRLELSFQKLRVFTADAAHELRTPLAIIRSSLDVALRADRTAERYRTVLVDAHEDVVGLCTLADRLLQMSQEDGPRIAPPRIPIRLDITLANAIEQMKSVAEAKGVAVEVGDFPEVMIAGDADRLRQVWLNLLDNAIKYTPAGGCISIRTEADEVGVRVFVDDTGPGIPSADIARVFDRFYRVDPSRNGRTGGVGLGLAICKGIVTSHGGSIKIANGCKQGTHMVVEFPHVSGENKVSGK